jgi:hypothetical protein
MQTPARRATSAVLDVLVAVLVLAMGHRLAGWIGLLVVGATLIVLTLGRLRSGPQVDQRTPCTKCAHAARDHQGPCQACLRDVVDGSATRPVPCSRYAAPSSVRPTGP